MGQTSLGGNRNVSPTINSLTLTTSNSAGGLIYDTTYDPQTLTITGALTLNSGAYLNFGYASFVAAGTVLLTRNLGSTASGYVSGNLTNSGQFSVNAASLTARFSLAHRSGMQAP